MAREKTPVPPPDDIPAWFMTYSDVITLLMTFFILLLTFATTEPERFEKTVSNTFSTGAATGTAGEKISHVDNDSWSKRIRPPAARVAMRGAEMPGITRESGKGALGEGLRSLDDEEQKQNELTTHYFDVPISVLFDSNENLTEHGIRISKMLSRQLEDLPFHASIQTREQAHLGRLSKLMHHLFHEEKTRPGQLSVSMSRNKEITEGRVRILIERFSANNVEDNPHHMAGK